MTSQAVEAMNRGSKQVDEGAELGNQAGDALGKIQDAIAGIVGQIEDMSAAAQQMSSSSAEVIKAIENVSAITEETSAAAEEMSASSGEVTQQIEQVAALERRERRGSRGSRRHHRGTECRSRRDGRCLRRPGEDGIRPTGSGLTVQAGQQRNTIKRSTWAADPSENFARQPRNEV